MDNGSSAGSRSQQKPGLNSVYSLSIKGRLVTLFLLSYISLSHRFFYFNESR